MANNLKQLRKARGFGVAELAQKLGMSQGNLTKIENGQVDMKAETAAALAGILQCPLEQLLDSGEISQEASPLAAYFNMPTDARTLAIRDDTMAPTLAPGDIAIIRPAAFCSGNGVYALQIGAKEVIRRLQALSDGKVALLCDNRFYQAEYAAPSELQFLGRVVGKISQTAIGG